MFKRFIGVFSEWHCKECNSIMKRKDVKYRSEFHGHYSRYWFVCLKCGSSKDVVPLKEREKEVVCKVCNKKQM